MLLKLMGKKWGLVSLLLPGGDMGDSIPPWVGAALVAIVAVAALGHLWYQPALAQGEEELYLTILHTNDEHSALLPHSPTADFNPGGVDPTVGGYARLAVAIDQIRTEKEKGGEPVLLLSAGDFIGGSPFSWLVPEGIPTELTLKHKLGYDAAAIGNHEFDYGPDALAAYLQAAGYPQAHQRTALLAANTRPPGGHPLAHTLLVELDNGLKVGLFGLLGDDAISVTADTGPLEFIEPHRTAREAVAELKDLGADLVIALSHSGLQEDRALAREVAGIHVIVGGHCHTALEEPVIEGETVIVQAGSVLQYLGVLELALNPETGQVRVRNQEAKQPFLVPVDGSLPQDPEIAGLVAQYTAQLNQLVAELTGGRFKDVLEPVVSSAAPLPDGPPLQETPFANFVTDAMRLVTAERTGQRVDVAIQANGSIRGTLLPGASAHARGQVSFYDLAKLVGLGYGQDGRAGYPIVSLYLTGEELRRVLEVAALLSELMGDTYFLQFSGIRYSFNPQNTILFTVPVLDLPLPTGRAVALGEIYLGEGVQPPEEGKYRPLARGEDTLYHVVTDSYILSFLPLAGEVLPWLEIIPKDQQGNPVYPADFHDLIVRVEGQELKVWQTVVEYAAAQPPGPGGIPHIPAYYHHTTGRITRVRTMPVLVWPLLGLAGAAAGSGFWLRRFRRRKTQEEPSPGK